MRVRIGSYWLAGNPSSSERDHSRCDGLTIAPRGGTQEQQGLRWPTARFQDRLNDSVQVSFTTSRKFSTLWQAEQFCFEYKLNPPHARKGTVTFRIDKEGTSNWLEYDAPNSVIDWPSFNLQGLTLHLSYTIRCPGFLLGATDASSGILTEDGGTLQTEDSGTILPE